MAAAETMVGTAQPPPPVYEPVASCPASVLLAEDGASLLHSTCALWATVFAKPGRTAETMQAAQQAELEGEAREEQWHVVWRPAVGGSGDQMVVAACRSFVRVIKAGDGQEVRVLALAHVASHPDTRGHGLGLQVVGAAMKRVDDDPTIAASLFQTGVPKFYTSKLGAVEISHGVVNSTGEGSDEKRRKGFWDPHVMLYPASAAGAWPKGAIDLMGPGY
jgi:hypothetical protein